ncbi:hypothetical protein PMG11_10102 [Penicillium brasilianum]|uniref:Uncharacterized protein n=1 Tax=Penicillium brasilianum TaxID=104259 RepID=A0A0F7U2M2_PENBI|nr:hypothetical protein PMG11_10102 [Penicillium brasilianum]
METESENHWKDSCKKVKGILRSLTPLKSSPESLSIFSTVFYPHVSDTELLDLGIQLHRLDMKTGKSAPPTIRYFRPRATFPDRFPDTSNACRKSLSLNAVWRIADREAVHPESSPMIDKDRFTILPWALEATYANYSFEMTQDEELELGHLSSAKGNYGWVWDHERDARINAARSCSPSKNCMRESEFAILNDVPTHLRCYSKKRLSTRLTHSSSKDELLADNSCHAWATVSIPECGTDSRPSRDEIGALVCTMLETMVCEKPLSDDERPRKYGHVFPVSLPM